MIVTAIAGIALHGLAAAAERAYDLVDVREQIEALHEGLAVPAPGWGFSADGTRVCVGFRVFRSEDGAPSTHADPQALVAGDRPCEFYGAKPGGRQWRVRDGTLVELASTRPASPRTVRKMFPMWGWDRRERLAPNGRYFASLLGPDLALRKVGDANATAITDDGTSPAPYFLGSDIWEASASIFSPTGRYFVGRRHDSTGIVPMRALDPFAHELTEFRYWGRVDQPLPRTTLVVVDADKADVALTVPPPPGDRYRFFIEWAADGERFLVVDVARDLREYVLSEITVADGGVSILHIQRSARAVKWPGGPRTTRYLNGGDEVLWRSDHTGYFHYYLIDREGGAPTRLTTGAFDVGDFIAHDEATDRFYFTAGTAARPLDRQLLRVTQRAEGAHEQRFLTSRHGVHSIKVEIDQDRFLDLHSAFDEPPTLRLRRLQDGAVLSTPFKAAVPAARSTWPSPEPFTIAGSLGPHSVTGMIFRPPDFDPERRYPVIERVYGAPSLLATPLGYYGFGEHGSGSDYTSVIGMLVRAGFVVVTIDGAGTPGRGRAIRQATYGRWPEGQVPEHLSTLQALAVERPWMDLSRLGIAGNSWGGFSALLAGIEAPNAYHAVSASVPQTSFTDHTAFIEFVLGAPAENPQAYARGELSERMDGWQSSLQLIAGTSDVNVPISNTLRLLDALAEQGKPYDLVLFPGTNHAHEGRGDRYAYAIASMVRFFQRELGGVQDRP